jgi:hypothetical protein
VVYAAFPGSALHSVSFFDAGTPRSAGQAAQPLLQPEAGKTFSSEDVQCLRFRPLSALLTNTLPEFLLHLFS